MERITMLTYKDKKIAYFNLSQIKSEKDALEAIEHVKKFVALYEKSSLLTLTNVKDSLFTPKVVKALKGLTVYDKPYVIKGAIIGLGGLQRVIYDAVMRFAGRNMPVFDGEEQAKDWLIEG